MIWVNYPFKASDADHTARVEHYTTECCLFTLNYSAHADNYIIISLNHSFLWFNNSRTYCNRLCSPAISLSKLKKRRRQKKTH